MPVPHIEFRLSTTIVVGGVTTPLTVTIEEPVKWDSISITAKRDEDFHGLNYEYSDGKVQIDFTCESSGGLLRNQYYTYGSDAVVKFLVINILANGTETVRFAGRIDFNPPFTIKTGVVSASVIRDDLNQKIQARKDSPISMDLSRTLDNGPITPPLTIDLGLPGQALREKAESKRIDIIDEEKDYDPALIVSKYTILPNVINTSKLSSTTPGPLDPITGQSTPGTPEISTLDGVSNYTGGIIVGDEIDYPLDKCLSAGSYTMEIDWVFQLIMTVTKGGGILNFSRARFAAWYVKPVLVVRTPGQDDVVTPLCPPQKGGSDVTDTPLLEFDGHYRGTFKVTQGTQIYVCAQIFVGVAPNIKKLRFSWRNFTARIAIDRTTRAVDSRGKAYTLPDALKHIFGVITNAIDINGTGALTGTLINKASLTQMSDGYATEYCVSSGNQLRNLSNKPPTFTFKELMGVLSAHHVAGMLYETNSQGKNSVRVEEGLWFYRGGRILVIEEVYSYEETPEDSLLVNKLTIGYSKFPDTGPGVLYEFNTTRVYQTPIVTNEQPKEINCPLIAAGVAIEEARKLGITTYDADGQVIDRSLEGGSYDDDGFLLHVAPISNHDVVTFLAVPYSGFLSPPTTRKTFQFGSESADNPKNLQVGDVVTFTGSGTANDNVPFTITVILDPTTTIGQFLGITHKQYQVISSAPLVATGPVLTNWSTSRQPVRIRTDERLDVFGVADPGTTYNLELSPARMLRRHGPFLNSGFRYKEAVDELRCIDYKNNREMASQVKPGMGPLPGDEDRQYITETGDVALGELNHFNRLWSPERIDAKVYIAKGDLNSLLLALRNEHSDEELNMGFITIKNPDGNYVDVDIFEIKYNPNSQVADLVLRKRLGDPLTGGPACIDYYDWQYQRFETDQSKDPNLYRFCRFRDFTPV